MNIDPILQAVRQAIMLCREVQHGTLRHTDKHNSDYQDTEPVTIADYGSQAILCRAIKRHFPDDAVVAEEAGDQYLSLTTPEQQARILNLLNTVLDERVTQDDIVGWLDHGKGRQAERTWVIDPIDGTKGFIAMRHYAIGVGILDANAQPVGGVMGCPGYGDGVSGYDEDGAVFYVRDGAAYIEPISGGRSQRIQPSARRQPAEMTVVQSFEREHASKERMARVREKAGLDAARVHELDSMEKYALVASGEADVYLRLPNPGSTRPHLTWDHAAGVALVLAAGGQATDLDGTALDFSGLKTLNNRGVVASSGVMHDRIIEAVKAVLAEEAAGE